MKLVIVHPPDPVASIASKVTQHPINLAQLAAYVQQFDVECEIWDYTVEPFALAQQDGRTVVTSHLVGNFPGSPVDLRYFFVLKDGMIAELEIVP